MKALLHFPSLHDVPEGVWWIDDQGLYQEHYVKGSILRPRGVMVMASMSRDVPPDGLFNYLSGRHSYFDVWAVVDSLEDESPRATLARISEVIKMEKKRLLRHAAAKVVPQVGPRPLRAS